MNRRNNPEHIFSDAYDFAQNAICFLCEFIGKELTDVYTVKNGKVITIKQATYTLVSRYVDRMRRNNYRACDIDNYVESLSVEIDHYEEKDYTEVDNKIEPLISLVYAPARLMKKRTAREISLSLVTVNVKTGK